MIDHELRKRFYQCLLHPDTMQALPIHASRLKQSFVLMNDDIDIDAALHSVGWSGVEPLLAELEEASVIETEAIKLVRGEAVLVNHLNKRLLLSLFAKSFNEWPVQFRAGNTNSSRKRKRCLTASEIEQEAERRVKRQQESIEPQEELAIDAAPIKKSSQPSMLSSAADLASISRIGAMPSAENEEAELLIATLSVRERESQRVLQTALDLSIQPTFRERSTANRFKSKGGSKLKEYCMYGTKRDCLREMGAKKACDKIHFRTIIQSHTDMSLGDCSYLDTCRHMKTCKFVHYNIDDDGATEDLSLSLSGVSASPAATQENMEWVCCDVRLFDFSLLGKFDVVLLDPPWDIHMELPYGTLSDDEMRTLSIQVLQDDGFCFLWVTGRAMELGRECLALWGYTTIEEVLWIKTNQLQRLIRTGRTGHWLNHSKEHCLVGVKGKPKANRGIDCDVIVAEVRETSRKPDELYGIIERLVPGGRKVEIFGRAHNLQPGWLTIGNQLDGVRIKDPVILERVMKEIEENAETARAAELGSSSS